MEMILYFTSNFFHFFIVYYLCNAKTKHECGFALAIGVETYTFVNVNRDHTIYVSLSGLGVDESLPIGVSVYPNPAKDTKASGEIHLGILNIRLQRMPPRSLSMESHTNTGLPTM